MKIHTHIDLIILKVFESSFAANIAKARLQENGIESFIEDENPIGMNPLGGTELKVTPENLEKAKEILAVEFF